MQFIRQLCWTESFVFTNYHFLFLRYVWSASPLPCYSKWNKMKTGRNESVENSSKLLNLAKFVLYVLSLTSVLFDYMIETWQSLEELCCYLLRLGQRRTVAACSLVCHRLMISVRHVHTCSWVAVFCSSRCSSHFCVSTSRHLCQSSRTSLARLSLCSLPSVTRRGSHPSCSSPVCLLSTSTSMPGGWCRRISSAETLSSMTSFKRCQLLVACCWLLLWVPVATVLMSTRRNGSWMGTCRFSITSRQVTIFIGVLFARCRDVYLMLHFLLECR